MQVMGDALGKEHTEYAAMLLNLAALLRRQAERSLDAMALLQESVTIYESQTAGFPPGDLLPPFSSRDAASGNLRAVFLAKGYSCSRTDGL